MRLGVSIPTAASQHMPAPSRPAPRPWPFPAAPLPRPAPEHVAAPCAIEELVRLARMAGAI